jgi:hypothetical protein
MVQTEGPLPQSSNLESCLVTVIVNRNVLSCPHIIDGYIGDIIINSIVFRLKKYLKNKIFILGEFDIVDHRLKRKGDQ